MFPSFAPVSPVAPAILMALSILEFSFYIIIYTRATRVTGAIGYITRFTDTKIALSSGAGWGDFFIRYGYLEFYLQIN
ncbi:hypothetical protein [Clostridium neonatale]|uniref:hypothetical protein n=1 Tax=Clostridium neonatale TaxID=137838 RepID=UPI00397809D7